MGTLFSLWSLALVVGCGLCATSMERSGFRVDTGFSQHNGGCQRGRFLVLGPGRTEDASHAIDVLVNLSGEFSECLLNAFVQLTFADANDRNFQVFKGMTESLPEEFTFRHVNEYMRCKDLVQRRQEPGGTQQNNRAYQRIT